MGIVIFADVFLASLSFLLADVANALFVDARACRTDLLDIAKLACATIDTTRRVALCVCTLPVWRETEASSTCRSDADAGFAFTSPPSRQ